MSGAIDILLPCEAAAGTAHSSAQGGGADAGGVVTPAAQAAVVCVQIRARGTPPGRDRVHGSRGRRGRRRGRVAARGAEVITLPAQSVTHGLYDAPVRVN